MCISRVGHLSPAIFNRESGERERRWTTNAYLDQFVLSIGKNAEILVQLLDAVRAHD